MFGKLMKHELRQTGRTMLPMLGGYLILALAACGANALNRYYSASNFGPVLQILSALALFLLILAMLALMVVVMVLCVQRFYRMLGDEGYLAFSLPVTPAQHIWSKLLCAVLWTVAALTAVAASMFLLMLPWGAVSASVWETAVPLPWSFALLMVLMALVGFSYVYLSIYFSCAVGSRWPQNRLAASVGVYVALNVTLQILMMVALITAALSPGLRGWLSGLLASAPARPDEVLSVVLLLGGWVTALGALASALYFFLTRWLLAKKLNLA